VDTTQGSVIVVGAGLAGLASAWRLSRRGFQVALLERTARVGGRASALREEGFALEAVSPVLTPADTRLLAWIAEVGLQDELLPLRPLVTQVAHQGSLHEVDVRGWLDVRRVPGVRLREALRVVRLPRLLARYASALDPERPERAADLDDRSLADFGRLYFGESVVSGWMAPFVTGDSSGDPEWMSRVQFLHQLRRQAGGRLGLLRGSLADVAERVASAVAARTGIEVVGVEPRDGGGARVRLADGRRIGADAVVLAVPAPDALRLAEPLLTGAERDLLAGVSYAPALTVAAALCRAPGPRPARVVVPRAESSPVECAILEPGLPGSRAPEGLGLALVRATPRYAASHLDAAEEAVAKDLLSALDALRPGLLRSVEFARLLRARHGAPLFDVGRYRAIARWQRVQDDLRSRGRRLYLAGDYLVSPTLEGAAVAAERAAEAVCHDLR
jgi:oxygen-dependent protoporphyrinogen oxidase